MKPREIRKVAATPGLTEGWLCVDARKYEGHYSILFSPGKAKPYLAGANSNDVLKGQWNRRVRVWGYRSWDRASWVANYGNAPLPKPGKCERVRLELDGSEE